jgi:hypothetical protein
MQILPFMVPALLKMREPMQGSSLHLSEMCTSSGTIKINTNLLMMSRRFDVLPTTRRTSKGKGLAPVFSPTPASSSSFSFYTLSLVVTDLDGEYPWRWRIMEAGRSGLKRGG